LSEIRRVEGTQVPAIDEQLQELVDQATDQLADRWERAETELNTILLESIEVECDVSDPDRVKLVASRVKSKARIAEKIQRRIRNHEIESPRCIEDVQNSIFDIIGLRIICKTLRDVDLASKAVAAAYGPRLEQVGDPKDYIRNPKQSGYRSLHYLLRVTVPEGDDRVAVPCEVQIRTMMQDAWGELTHENSYKSGDVALPGLFLDLSRHMADLMDQVDQLALTLAEASEAMMTQMAVDNESPLLEASAEASRTGLEVGRVYLGRVLTSGRNYALVLVDQFRGLLGASEVKQVLGLDSFVEVSNYVLPGDSLQVRVLEHDPIRDRLLVEPADPADLRRRRNRRRG
jgi:putative GTP pyrophosphokinase